MSTDLSTIFIQKRAEALFCICAGGESRTHTIWLATKCSTAKLRPQFAYFYYTQTINKFKILLVAWIFRLSLQAEFLRSRTQLFFLLKKYDSVLHMYQKIWINSYFFLMCTRRDSNPQQLLRRQAWYPFHYGCIMYLLIITYIFLLSKYVY